MDTAMYQQISTLEENLQQNKWHRFYLGCGSAALDGIKENNFEKLLNLFYP
ncbi:MAG: hypothetical protein ACLSCV_02395 [Acutalibacteraceae bacterium]